MLAIRCAIVISDVADRQIALLAYDAHFAVTVERHGANADCAENVDCGNMCELFHGLPFLWVLFLNRI